jgi:cis-3-alkyl-4-acyloxetan-2-one decarboxylase
MQEKVRHTDETLPVGGVTLRVEGQGAETLLMVHGWPDTLQLWDGSVAALRDRFRCARFTLPGYCAGDPLRLWTLDEMDAIFLAVVDRLCPGGRVTLVLHDWGCAFGYQFAMRHPDRVARIVGLDVGDAEALPHTLGPVEMGKILAYQVWLAAAWRIGGAFGDAMSRGMAGLLRVPADRATISSRMNWPYYLVWFGGAQSPRRTAVPFRPACPMFFAWGRRKPFQFHTPRWADALAARPECRVEAFGTGHWVMLDAPQRFHAMLREWLLKDAAAAGFAASP